VAQALEKIVRRAIFLHDDNDVLKIRDLRASGYRPNDASSHKPFAVSFIYVLL